MATTTEQPAAAAATTEHEPTDQALVPARPSPAGANLMQRAGTMSMAFAGLVPTSIGEAVILAQHLTKSTAVPSSLRNNPDTMLTVILAGIELGLSPIRAVQSITNISGTLCMKADLQLALVKGRPGVLAFYDEGFERYEKTDTNLERRIDLSLGKFLRAKLSTLGMTQAAVADNVKDDVTLVIEKIAAATADGMKAGDPYGWAVGIRQGDPVVHVRTFTYADAVKAIIYEKDEANPGAPKERKPLAEKFNYKSFPGDMYPKRARTRLLQVLASDVTNGLPAAEAVEGGQVIDAEFTVDVSAPGDDVDTLLAAIRDQDSDLATTVENGFKQLQLGKAGQLQKLTQFKGKPKDLVDWLKTEWANRKGKDRQRPDVLGDQPGPNAAGGSAGAQQPAAKTDPAKPAAPSLSDLAAQAQTTSQPGPQVAQPGEVIDAEITDEELEASPGVQAALADIERAAAERRAADAAAAKPMTPAKDLAARFRAGKLKTF